MISKCPSPDDLPPDLARLLLVVLRARQSECDGIRHFLKIRDRDEIMARFPGSEPEREIFVLADGFGVASIQEVEGVYPTDSLTVRHRKLGTEGEAEQLIEQIEDGFLDW